MASVTLKPTTNKLELVTFYSPGSTGGGGGSKIYATEVALLAATPAAGTLGYAQDTGSFWFRRDDSWQPIPSPVSVRRLTGPYDIQVDPVNGDDGDWNDGTTTPLKTLEALFKRLPQAVQSSRGLDKFRAAEKSVRVRLLAGDHNIPDDLVSPYAMLDVDVGNIAFWGELSAGTSFSIDHWSVGGMKIHQPAGNPAWTPDEHVGKVIAVPYTYPAPIGPIEFYFFILGNSTHDLTVAVTSTYWQYIAPAGTTISIKSLLTRWVGPRTVIPHGSQTWSSGFNLIEFNSDLTSEYNGMFYAQSGSLVFNNCLLKTTVSTYGSPRPFGIVTGTGEWTLSNCMVLNHKNNAMSVNDGGRLNLYSISAVGTQRVATFDGDSHLNILGSISLKDCVECFMGGADGGHKGARVYWYPYSLIYCPNTGTNILTMFFFNPGRSALDVMGRYMEVPDPTAVPVGLFSINDDCKLRLQEWTLEAAVPVYTFVVGGYGRVQPQFWFSLADLYAVYQGHLDAGWGCEIIG